MKRVCACLLSTMVVANVLACNDARRPAGTPGPSSPPAIARPSEVGTLADTVPASSLDKLREISRRFGVNLSLADLRRLVGADFEVAGEGFWSAELSDGSTVLARAAAVHAAVTWLKFRLSPAAGLTFAEATRIYGENRTIREGQKDGTDIHYDPGAASSVPPGTYVGLQLWERSAELSAPVTQVTLSAPDVRSANE